MEFVIKTIGEIEQILQTGKTPPSKIEKYYKDGKLNWYTPSDLGNEKFLGISKKTVSIYAIDDGKVYILPPKSLLISCIGEIGKLGITSKSSCTNQQLTALVPKKEVDVEYLFYWLKKNKLVLEKNSKKAIVPILNNRNLRRVKIKFPKLLADQKRIAKILSDCEQLITWRKETIQLLDDYLEATFLEMFGDPVKNEKGWNVNKLSDLSTIKIGPFGSLIHKEDYIIDGIPIVNPSHIKDNKIVTDNKLTVSIEKSKILESYKLIENDIILGRRGEIGRCAIVDKYSEGFLCGTGSLFIRPGKEIVPLYLEFFIKTKRIRGVLESVAKGVTMKNINSKMIEQLNIPLPPINLQNQFLNIVEKTLLIKTDFQYSLQSLENLYNSLSQKAFKGELDLIKVEIEEDTEKLKQEHKIISQNHFGSGDNVSGNVINAEKGTLLKLQEYESFNSHLKKIYGDKSFSYLNIEESFNAEEWLRELNFSSEKLKSTIYKLMESSQPKIEQFFDTSDGRIKLKLTDEALKA